MDKNISQLRTFFRVSNAAFEFQNSIQLAFSGHIAPSKMHQLHRLALEEIEKESPDLSKIDNLLEEMESLAELNSQPKPKFPKGGVSGGLDKYFSDLEDYEFSLCCDECGNEKLQFSRNTSNNSVHWCDKCKR